MIRIAYFGTDEFSANILEYLIECHNIKVELIVSQIDKPSSRGQTIKATKVKQIGLMNGILVLQAPELDDSVSRIIKKLDLDFIVVVSFGKILPKAILDASKYMTLNIHPSLLPKYRGASPIQETLKNGDEETGVSIIRMNERMDEGDIVMQEKINISIYDTAKTIFEKVEEISGELLMQTFRGVIENSIISHPQDNSKASYCSKIKKEDSKISFQNEIAENIYNKWRAYIIWPGIYSYYNGKKISFEECFFDNEDKHDYKLGEVFKQEKEICIKCKKGYIILKKIKLEGKKEIQINDFLNGNKNFVGYIFE